MKYYRSEWISDEVVSLEADGEGHVDGASVADVGQGKQGWNYYIVQLSVLKKKLPERYFETGIT